MCRRIWNVETRKNYSPKPGTRRSIVQRYPDSAVATAGYELLENTTRIPMVTRRFRKVDFTLRPASSDLELTLSQSLVPFDQGIEFTFGFPVHAFYLQLKVKVICKRSFPDVSLKADQRDGLPEPTPHLISTWNRSNLKEIVSWRQSKGTSGETISSKNLFLARRRKNRRKSLEHLQRMQVSFRGDVSNASYFEQLHWTPATSLHKPLLTSTALTQ